MEREGRKRKVKVYKTVETLEETEKTVKSVMPYGETCFNSERLRLPQDVEQTESGVERDNVKSLALVPRTSKRCCS